MKKLLVLLVVVFIAVFAWRIYRGMSSQSTKGPGREFGGPVVVEAADVVNRTIHDTALFTGTLAARSEITVSPKVAGRLEQLTVDTGDTIKKDQLIAMLDDDEYAQQVEQARAELLVAQANVTEAVSALDVARRDLERVKALRRETIASEAELDQAEARFAAAEAKAAVAKAQVAQREAALRGAEIRLSYTQIRATWHEDTERQFIGERFVHEGALLRANDPIVSLLDIDSLITVVHVIERDYPRLKIGQHAEITTDAFPGRLFSGKVIRIAPMLRESSRQARVEVEVPNADHLLKPGMFVRAKITFEEYADATVVPLQSIVRREGKQGVYALRPGNAGDKPNTFTAVFVPLEIGIISEELAQVKSPELSGRVVTLGHHLLKKDSMVMIPGNDPGKSAGREASPK